MDAKKVNFQTARRVRKLKSRTEDHWAIILTFAGLVIYEKLIMLNLSI